VLDSINIGTVANDGTGDSPRVAGGKINTNFTALVKASVVLPTYADIAATSFPATTVAFRTANYATDGDGGGALWFQVGSEPSHAGKAQSSDGQWWEIDRRELRPEQFGAVNEGSADDSDAVQDCVDAMQSGSVLVARGTYRIDTTVTSSTSNTTFDLRGSTWVATNLGYNKSTFANGSVFRVLGTDVISTTLASSLALGSVSPTLTSASGVQTGDIVRFISTQVLYDNAGTLAYYTDVNRVTNVAGSTIKLEVPAHLALTTSGQTVTVEIKRPVTNVKFIGGYFQGGGVTENMSNGFGRVAISAYGVAQFTVRDVVTDGFQGFAIVTDYAVDVGVYNCDMVGIGDTVAITEGQNSSFYGVYFYRTRRGLVHGCRGVRVRHLADAAEGYAITQSNNWAVDTHRAAFGSHEEVHDLQITGNHAQGCYAGALVRAWTCDIDGNTFDGDGRAINTATTNDAYSPGRLKITNNRLRTHDASFGASVDILGMYEPLIISNNEIVQPNGYGIWLNAERINNALVANNNIMFTGGSGTMGVAVEKQPYIKNLVIRGNVVSGYTGSAVIMDGATNPSDPAEFIVVEGNTGFASSGASGVGFRLNTDGYFGNSIVFKNNVHLNDSSAVLNLCSGQEYRLASAPIAEGNVGWPKVGVHEVIGSNTSAAHTGKSTVLTGQRILRFPVVTGSPYMWYVSTAGTEGTIAGVTGDITSGTTALTLTGNSADKVRLGAYLTITGAGVAAADLVARVTAIADDFASCTIDTAASTTVSGTAIALRNPTITASANL
jgi:hypothetical protein